jgi:hypothetical protein
VVDWQRQGRTALRMRLQEGVQLAPADIHVGDARAHQINVRESGTTSRIQAMARGTLPEEESPAAFDLRPVEARDRRHHGRSASSGNRSTTPTSGALPGGLAVILSAQKDRRHEAEGDGHGEHRDDPSRDHVPAHQSTTALAIIWTYGFTSKSVMRSPIMK